MYIMDRLQALLNGRTPTVKDPKSVNQVSHAVERSRLNNADRHFNQIVYDNELKQANLYNQSAMPNTGKDIGVSFKINVYVIRLTQLLGIKGDLEKTLTNYFATGVSVQRLRGTTRESQVATDFFKKADILSTYNELMLYIKTYAQDIISDDAFKAQVFNTSFNPLIQLLQDTSALYPSFFNSLPAPSNVGLPTEKKDERKIYETVREQCLGCYSLFNTMAGFMNNMIFRPIVKEDVSKYISDNRVAVVFSRNPLAPQAAQAPIVPGQPIVPAQPGGQLGQPGGQPGGQPAQAVLPTLDPADVASITQIVEDYQAQLGRFLFIRSSTDPQDALNASQANYEPYTAAIRKTAIANIKLKIQEIRTAVGLPATARQNTGTNLNEAQLAYQAFQQQQQGQAAPVPPQPAPVPPQPAPQPAQAPARQLTAPQQAYADAGGTQQPNQIPDLSLQQTAEVFSLIKQLEDTNQRPLTPTMADGRVLFQSLPQDIQDALMRVGTGNELPDTDTAVQDNLLPFLNNIFQQRKAWGQQQQPRVRQETLYGLGRERNNNLIENAILDFESMARRQAREQDKDTIMGMSPSLEGLDPKVRLMINRMRNDRKNEPNMFGKGKHEYKQGIIQRASILPIFEEFEPKAEALKRGKIMSGGCDTCSLRGGMGNTEWNYAGYGEVMNEEDTPFKRMLGGIRNPFAPSIPISTQPHKFLPYDSTFSDEEDNDYYDEVVGGEEGHYAELEAPVDMDANADAIRKNNENYKVMTGKMKNVKYKN